MVNPKLKPPVGTRYSLVVTRGALFIAIASIAAACGGGDPGADTVTLGTGQGQSADPVTVDFPIFYTKRAVPTAMQLQQNPPDVLETVVFDSGVDLFMRTSASPSAPETNLTTSLTKGLGDVRDVDVSFDGKKVIFAMRFPKRANQQERNQPQSWDIYEYDIPTATLRPLLVDAPVANGAPKFHDRFPHYLPDGRIVFSSSRQRTAQAVLLDENKPQYQAQDENDNEHAMNLHVMDKDGGSLRQISFNQSHDLDSGVLSNGQIVFSRWDGAGATDHVALYKMNPDGSGLELLYGKQNATHAVGLTRPATFGGTAASTTVVQFLSPRPLQDGRVLTLVRPFTGTEEGGDLHAIDVNTYVENTQPTLANAGMTGPAYSRVPATVIYANGNPTTMNMNDPGYSPGGRYRSAYPLPDGSNRLLVSWSQCRLLHVLDATTTPPLTEPVPCTDENLGVTPAMVAAPPLYGIYIYNLTQGTQVPIVLPVADAIYGDVVAGAPRTLPPVILDRVPGLDYAQALNTQAVGIIDIKSVYDLDGVDSSLPVGIGGLRNPAVASVTTRPAAFLRVEKAVSMPDDDVRDIKGTSFGPTGRFMREILGYAPIEPDGSVRVRVPANVPIQLTMVDRNARRISPLHRNWMQVQIGEVVTCNGCHTPNQPAAPATPRSHGRSGLFASINTGAPSNGLFPNTDSALQGNSGDTMAQARARRMCALAPGPSACSLSVDVIYNDLWTSTAVRAKDASFDYCYSVGGTDTPSNAADPSIKHTCTSALTTQAPVRAACERTWNGTCRIVVNYRTHIQPLWEADRIVGAANNKCVTCHSPQDAMMKAQIPAGQLDLSSTDSTDEPDHVTSYEKLLFSHIAQQLNATMTALQDVCLQFDPVTNVCTQFQVVSGSMSAANARGSRFFTAVNATSHAGFLSAAEQRLISEWLDIGAQYFNDPFLAPEN